MRTSSVLLVLGWTAALSCGRAERKDDAAAIASGAGAAGETSNAPATNPCGAVNAFPIWGKPYDADRDCIDTEERLDEVSFCDLTPGPGDDQYYSDGFSCLERLSDGQQVWVMAFYRLGFDPMVWKRCPHAPKIAPKGCYAAGCTEAPRSTCPLALTQQHYHCSSTGEYDENCCGRTPCQVDDDCQAGQSCQSVPSVGQWWCWDNPGSECDCGGPFGGPNKMLCMPNATP